MQGLMGDLPLTINWILERGERYYGGKEIVTKTASGVERSTYGEVIDRGPPHRDRARRPRHLRGRPGRHVRMEHRAAPRAVPRDPEHRPGDAHDQHPVLPRAAHVHGRARRGRSGVRRPLPVAAAREAPGQAADGAAHHRDGRRRRRRTPGRPADQGLRRTGRRRGTRRPRRPRHGRAAGCRDLLHDGHHRQPERRVLLAPLALAALERRARRPARSASPSPTGCSLSCRCSTPMPGDCRTRHSWPVRR